MFLSLTLSGSPFKSPNEDGENFLLLICKCQLCEKFKENTTSFAFE